MPASTLLALLCLIVVPCLLVLALLTLSTLDAHRENAPLREMRRAEREARP